MAWMVSLKMGNKIPITIADTIKIQSLRVMRNIFWNIKDRIKAEITTIIWAASIPKANSISGKNLLDESGKIILKYLENPRPWITPKNAALI